MSAATHRLIVETVPLPSVTIVPKGLGASPGIATLKLSDSKVIASI